MVRIPTRLLLVENRDADRRLFAQGAQGTGVQITPASTLAEARSTLQSTPDDPPSVMVVALRLPDGSGLELLQWSKSARPTLPVVVFSASDAPEDVRRAYELGASAYVHKPPGARGFVEAVRAMCWFWSYVQAE